MAVTDWKTDPGQNTTVGGIFIGEGCPPSNLNDAIRELMAELAGYLSPADYAIYRNMIGAAKSGVNADITALTGLTVPITPPGPTLRIVNIDTQLGTGGTQTIAYGTITVDRTCSMDVDLSYNQTYASGPRTTQSVLIIDGQNYNNNASPAVIVPTVAYGDQVPLAAGTHTIALNWIGQDSSVGVANVRLRARVFY